jgi:hypothetical protein
MTVKWKCFLVNERPKPGDDNYKPGAMWFGERFDDLDKYLYWPSKEFLASTRRPLYVLLPSNTKWLELFLLDMAPSSDESGGWTYTGTPPEVTLSPSINCVGRYHGFIQNGYVTADCEGRRFPEMEKYGVPA